MLNCHLRYGALGCAGAFGGAFMARGAPTRWEAYLADELKKMGFARGRASPCCFAHSSRDLRCVVHGDDVVFVGPDSELTWVSARMNESFLVKVVGKRGGATGAFGSSGC